MNNRFFVSLLLGALPLTLLAQDDDMYFVPTKKNVERATADYGMPSSTYYSGSNRSVDEYNRRSAVGSSYYQVVAKDTTGRGDVIDFSAERGVYPDSMQTEDFTLTRQMARYDGYEPDAAYREGYRDGRRDSWHSPWFYSSYYPWYDSWYDPWYYRPYGWYYSTWYDPWYYDYYWHRPYGWYGGWYGGYYPHYHGGGWIGSGKSRLYARNGNTGTIDRSGRSHGSFNRSGSTRYGSTNSSRASYNRSSSSGNFSRNSSSGNYNRSSSSSGNFSRSSSSSSGSFSRSSSSGGGSFSRSSSGGGGFSGGGGGSSRGGGGFGRVGR